VAAVAAVAIEHGGIVDALWYLTVH